MRPAPGTTHAMPRTARTSRAAARTTHLTGHAARTIHRLARTTDRNTVTTHTEESPMSTMSTFSAAALPRRTAARLVAGIAAVAVLTGPAASLATAGEAPAARTAAAGLRTAPAAADWPTLRASAKGTSVTALQHLLNSRGQSLAVDGSFGPATTAGVKAFQKAQRLTVDGVVGVGTWSRLVTTLREGAKGPAVKAAQTLLKARGQAVAVDGAFTAAVTAKVKAFQKSAGLTADGVVGARTWAALLSGTPSGGDRAALAKQILAQKQIVLATVHPGGKHAGSTARQNIVDTANGKGALTSPWGDKPNRRVALDPRMLNGLLKLRTQYGYRISVSEIVGGDHSSNSRHYAGIAFDITHINGRHVGSGAPHKQFMAACKKLGAPEVLGPGDAGHSRHVHCGWPR
ncbi:peptidoglycan-binding protein [Streptomyces sp. ML-6]|uniref:peptidoglycan-binding domain-containing protein n=1 Tax=Streptomyces sp. ML-6 TaxID=2982693 RepID=UPI0024C0CDFE|nr:peptidoglycan-binding protein [Streptomyces sp. ML-6]MDK0523387.1 peptidoglycan-binding protein [Streptomyces sp. ML-6]